MSVVARIAAMVRADRREGVRVIGIDGPSGSGKSTLARRVGAELQAPIVEVDDFVAWDDVAGWWPRFDAQVLQPLFAGRDARYQVRDWVGDEFGRSLGAWKTLPWHPIVIVEGVTCTRRAVADRLACRVWVEVAPELRLRRGLERDGNAHRFLWERWMSEEAAFFAEDDTRNRADLLVDGDAPLD